MTHNQPLGFLAKPKTNISAGVLVLHAWWGLNQTFKEVCSRLAEAGYLAFAPDLYHGKIAQTIPEAEALSQRLNANSAQAEAEIKNAAEFLSAQCGQKSLAVIGFSLGAYYALELAATAPQLIHAAVIFYGTGNADPRQSQAAYLGHFAEQDEYEPLAYVSGLETSLKRAGRPTTFHHYADTGHWFFEPDRTAAHNAAASKLAWERTLDFLKQYNAT